MHIFLSWSGPRSKQVAEALDPWLRDVLRVVQPFFSAASIPVGATFRAELSASIEKAQFCILCLTNDNIGSPWLNYEAGAIGERLKGKVCPYMLDNVDWSSLNGPLSSYQGVRATKEGTLDLLKTLNGHLPEEHRPRDLEDTFRMYWDRLDEKLRGIPGPNVAPPPTPSINETGLELRQMIQVLLERTEHLEQPVILPRPSLERFGEFDASRFGYKVERELRKYDHDPLWYVAPLDTPDGVAFDLLHEKVEVGVRAQYRRALGAAHFSRNPVQVVAKAIGAFLADFQRRKVSLPMKVDLGDVGFLEFIELRFAKDAPS